MPSATDELRIAVVFRSDIEIPRGKAEVQFGHAVASVLHKADTALVDAYMAGSQLKLSMEVDSEAVLDYIMRRAALRKVPAVKITDAGRTVFGEPTVTCIGLGPMDKTACNALTRKARMR